MLAPACTAYTAVQAVFRCAPSMLWTTHLARYSQPCADRLSVANKRRIYLQRQQANQSMPLYQAFAQCVIQRKTSETAHLQVGVILLRRTHGRGVDVLHDFLREAEDSH